MKIVSRKVVALSCLSVLASYTGAVNLTSQVQAQPGRVRSTSMDKIPCVRWYDEKADNKAVLFCIHGLGLHKGTYEEFGQEMARRGLITYAIDVRGFGTWTQKQRDAQLDLNGALATSDVLLPTSDACIPTCQSSSWANQWVEQLLSIPLRKTQN
ncbi:MAG: alpha/beta hydrolase [Candidatus Obscuribacter sp.]|nr:alpha/beta hydrolase [Candidatus Obscuribacter sp.]